MHKHLFASLAGLLFALSTTRYAMAQPQDAFETSYETIYSIDQTGETDVLQKVKITNKVNSVIATSYSITVKQIHIYDVRGKDSDGDVDLDVKETDAGTSINARFNNPAVGEGRAKTIEIGYKTKDIATKVGEIWNVHVPFALAQEGVGDYKSTLNIPLTFGPEIYISPRPITKETKAGYVAYDFNRAGVSASFGTHQTMNFKLQYSLKNTKALPVLQEIALPHDIQSRQQIIYKELSPQPRNIRVDKDGNILAAYEVRPKEQINVSLTGSAQIYSMQIRPEFGGSISDIPKDLVGLYTKSDKFWEVDSRDIQLKAKELYNSNMTVAQNAQSIYGFITTNLSYDFELAKKDYVERSGAISALTTDTPKACMEFTDLFIALARAMKIPAREINGYAFAKESANEPLSISLKGGDFLHSWPEYFDPVFGWVAIDPTWGATSKTDYFTKLDTNHIAFVTKGIDSEYPTPAGTYKVSGSERQVEVGFAQTDTPKNEEITLYETINWNPIAILKRETEALAVNKGNVTIYDINSTKSKLPPYATQSIYIDKNDKVIKYKDFNGEAKTQRVDIVPNVQRTKVKANFVFVAFSLMLGLCTISYLLVIQPKYRKRLPHLLRYLLEALGQLHSRRWK